MNAEQRARELLAEEVGCEVDELELAFIQREDAIRAITRALESAGPAKPELCGCGKPAEYMAKGGGWCCNKYGIKCRPQQPEAQTALTEQQKADRDAVMYGTGFMLGGKHIPAQDVMVVQAHQQPEAQAVPEPPRYRMTTGHCPNKSAGSRDCGLHNLHCNWPKCDQRIELLNPTPPPSEHPEAQAGEAVAEVVHPAHPNPDSACFVRLLRKDLPFGTKLYTTPPAKVPEGYVLVPVEPEYEVVCKLASEWGYTAEEAASTYEQVIEAAAPAPKEGEG